MPTRDLHYCELVEIGQRIQKRELSPVEATQAQLDRIARLDGQLKSYAYVMASSALEQAHAAEKEIGSGKVRGPLHGVPIAVKDLCWTKDAPTAAGMRIYRDNRPTQDATVVARLKEAGAVVLGKLQLTEGAYADHHPDIDPPRNPWDATLWSGASSSGSGVATAAGLCYGSLGSDTGGSIRFPSAANGVTGLKPTWGRVSRYGVFELAATLDHIGPMARSAVDCGAILGAIAGADPNDPTAVLEPVPDYLADLRGSLRGTRIGVDRRWTSDGVDAAATKVFQDALRVATDLGAEIHEIVFPDPTAMITDWFPLCGVETELCAFFAVLAGAEQPHPLLDEVVQELPPPVGRTVVGAIGLGQLVDPHHGVRGVEVRLALGDLVRDHRPGARGQHELVGPGTRPDVGARSPVEQASRLLVPKSATPSVPATLPKVHISEARTWGPSLLRAHPLEWDATES